MFVLASAIFFAVVIGSAFVWWYSHVRTTVAGLPSLHTGRFTIFKDLYYLLWDNNLLNVIKLLTKRSEETQLPTVYWLGPLMPVISLSNSEDLKPVLNNFLASPPIYDIAKILLGNGLITAPVSLWQRNRKKLGSFFLYGNLMNNYQKVFNAQAHELVQKMREEVGRGPFDLQRKYLDVTAMAAIYQITVNQRLNKANSMVCNAYNRSLSLFTERFFNPLLYSDFIYRLTPSYIELKGHVNFLNNLLKKELEDRIRERNNIKNGSKNYDEISTTYLDHLLDLSEEDDMFTKEHMIAELNTMVVSGHESISLIFTLLLHSIGKNLDVQEKIYAELNEVFGDTVQQVSKEDLSRMKYCEAVINETLRLFPSAPVVLRKADKDLPLKSFTIHKGTICCINLWGVQRSKTAWGPDAEVFRPERWLENKTLPPATFIPFCYGKRMCIGFKYSMAFMKTMLAYCISEFRVRSEDAELQLNLNVLLKPVSGHLLQIELRK